MNKTKYNQLREEIIKANKDIMRLTMGCVVETERIDFYGKQLKQKWTLGHYDSEGGCWRCEDNEAIEKQEIIKIIGRPISLEDCLITWLKKDGCPITFKEAYKGDIGHDWENVMFVFRDMNWQLNKPLQDQSDETINFLHNLICNK